LPSRGRQGASERARHLRRAAAGEEKERRDDEPAYRRAAAALGIVLRPRIACYLHGLILVCSQRGGERKGVGCQNSGRVTRNHDLQQNADLKPHTPRRAATPSALLHPDEACSRSKLAVGSTQTGLSAAQAGFAKYIIPNPVIA
jgi:hypothetical protein